MGRLKKFLEEKIPRNLLDHLGTSQPRHEIEAVQYRQWKYFSGDRTVEIGEFDEAKKFG